MTHRSLRLRTAMVLLIAGSALGGTAATAPAVAQDAPEARIRKLEAEVRALQRKVFPNGAAASFEPEITRPAPPAATPGAPTTTAVSDLLVRMDAVEAQMARLTGQIEQNTNRIGQLETRLGAAGAEGPIPPVGGSVITVPRAPADASPANVSPPPGGTSGTSGRPGASRTPGQGSPPRAGGAEAPAQTSGGPSTQRLAAVQGVERPQSGDPGDDAYSYGYRLWGAKLFPEAEQQLKLFVQTYPKHPRISYGRNLLGRTYLDEGNPREAAKWFLQNYQADKMGPRAPDSLLFLAGSMKQLNDTRRACIALAEFSSTYAAEAAGRLKPDYDRIRTGLTCT